MLTKTIVKVFAALLTLLLAAGSAYKYVYNPFSPLWGERTIMIKQDERWKGKDVYLNVYDYRTGRSSHPWPGIAMEKVSDGIFRGKISRHLRKPAIIFSYHRREVARVIIEDGIDACYLHQVGRWVEGDCQIKPRVPFARIVGFDDKVYRDGESVYLQRDLTGSGHYTLDGSDPKFSHTRKEFDYNTKLTLPVLKVGESLQIRLYAVNPLGEVFNHKTLKREAPPAACYPRFDKPADAGLSPMKKNEFENLRIYHVFVPSFIDGNPNRGYIHGWGPGPHSGDLEGVLSSLDYIASLKVNALWISPIFDSADHEGGHKKSNATGYYPKYFFDVDRQFGDMDLLKKVVDKAHSLGLYVFFDGIVHHHKNLYGKTPPLSPCGQQLAAGEDHLLPYPESMEYFKEYLIYWIEKLGIDGWRIDKAFPLKRRDWAELRSAVEAISEHRKTRGEKWGTLGYMVAESFEGAPQNINEQVYGAGGEAGMFSAFDFPTRYSLVQILAVAENITEMNGRVGTQPAYLLDTAYGLSGHVVYGKSAVPNMMLGNHDLVRFGDLIERSGKARYGEQGYWKRHALAFAFMTAYPGAITLYYGEEIGLQVDGFDREVEDPHCHSVHCDLHVGRSAHRIVGVINNFWKDNISLTKQEQWLLGEWRELMQLRIDYPALVHGTRTHLFSNEALYADLKTMEKQQVIFIMNTAEKGIWLELDLSNIKGNSLKDIRKQQFYEISNKKAKIWVEGLQAKFLEVRS